jgi:hypothetical protein
MFERKEQQLRVSHRAGPAPVDAQRADELIAIVEPDIRYKREAATLRYQRLAVIDILGE